VVEGLLSRAGGVLRSSRLGPTVLLSCLRSLRWGAWVRELALSNLSAFYKEIAHVGRSRA
jgi:hypothetical protein